MGPSANAPRRALRRSRRRLPMHSPSGRRRQSLCHRVLCALPPIAAPTAVRRGAPAEGQLPTAFPPLETRSRSRQTVGALSRLRHGPVPPSQCGSPEELPCDVPRLRRHEVRRVRLRLDKARSVLAQSGSSNITVGYQWSTSGGSDAATMWPRSTRLTWPRLASR
jgi:hypothetical protein